MPDTDPIALAIAQEQEDANAAAGGIAPNPVAHISKPPPVPVPRLEHPINRDVALKEPASSTFRVGGQNAHDEEIPFWKPDAGEPQVPQAAAQSPLEQDTQSPATASPPVDPDVDPIAAQLGQEQDRENSIQAQLLQWRAANDKTPAGKRADVMRYAAASGLAPDFVEQHLDDVKLKVDASKVDWNQVAYRQPKLAEFLLERPELTPVVKDDTANLSGLSWLMGSPLQATLDVATGTKSDARFFGAPANAFYDALMQQGVVARQFLEAEGFGSKANRKEIRKGEKRYSNVDYGADSVLTHGVIGLAQGIPYVVGDIASRALGAWIGGTIGAGFGAGAGGAGGAAAGAPVGGVGAIPGAGVGAVGGGAIGGGAGATVGQYLGSFGFNYYENVGPLYWRLSQLKDANGNPMDPNVAHALSQGGAAVTAALMAGFFGKIGGSLPGVKQLLAKAGLETVESTLAKQSVATAIRTGALKYGQHLITGAALMAAQSGVNAAAGEGAKAVSGQPFETHWDNVTQATKDGFASGLEDMWLLTAIGPGREMLRDVGQARASGESTARLEALTESAKASKLLERLPEAFRDLVAKQKEEKGAVQNVHIPVEDWVSYWQEQKLDPGEVASHIIGDDGKAFADASATKGDVVIPIERYLETLSKSKHAQEMLQRARLFADELSPKQLAERNAELERRMEEAAKSRGAEFEDGKKEVHDFIKSSALEAGVDKESAAATAKLVSEYAGAMALRLGMGVQEASKLGALGQLRVLGPKGELVAAAAREKFANFLTRSPEETIVRSRLASLSPEARIDEAHRHEVTGLLDEKTFNHIKDPERPMVGRLSVEGIKYLNDKVSHDYADQLYRTVAKVVHEVAPETHPAFIGGDLALHVKDAKELSAILEKVNEKNPIKGFGVSGAVGKDFETAGDLAKQDKVAAEAAGTRAGRGERPLGFKGEPGAITFPEGRARAAVPEELARETGSLPDEEYIKRHYKDASGAWTAKGWKHLPRKAHVIAFDLSGLGLANEVHGKDMGDRMIDRMKRVAMKVGGNLFDFSHLHGDEYAAQHNNPEAAEAFVKHLKAGLAAEPVEYVERETGEVAYNHLHFWYGIGERSYENADHDLNERKRQAKASGEYTDPLEFPPRDAPGAVDDVGGGRSGSGNDGGGSGPGNREGNEAAPGSAPGGPGENRTPEEVGRDEQLKKQALSVIVKMKPERQALATEWLRYCEGMTEERPTDVPDALKKTLAEYGIVDPQGFEWDESGRSMDRPLPGPRVKGEEPPELRRQRLARQSFEQHGEDRTKYEQPGLPVTHIEGNTVTLEQPGRRGPKAPKPPSSIEPPGTEAFKKWFGESKVVDAKGKPLLVFHGSKHSGFESFDPKYQDPNGLYGPGFYFTADPEIAGEYTDKGGRLVAEPGEKPGVYPVYLSIKNPLDAAKPASTYVSKLREFKAEAPPAQIKRMIDSALREESENFTIEGLGAWVDNTEWAYKIADKAGKNGEELLAPYFDYVLSKARDYMVREIQAKRWSTGDDVIGFIKRNVFDRLVTTEGDSNVQEVLKKLGFDGIAHVGGNIMGGGREHQVFIAFDPHQVKSPFNRGTFDPTDVSILHSEGTGGDGGGERPPPRGEIRMTLEDGGQPTSFDVRILNGDKSTFLHEMSHFLSWSFHDIATSDRATPELREDYRQLLEWMGHGTPEERTAANEERKALSQKETRTPEEEVRLKQLTAREERLSHGFEQYVAEGKAPSSALARVFSKFRDWMLRIYKGVQGIQAQYRQNYGEDIALSDDVRGIFDRLLAQDEALGEASRTVGADVPFDVTKGMSTAEQEAYRKALEDAKVSGEQEIAKRMAELQGHQVDEARTRIRQEVTAELDKQPVYRAMRFLQRGELVDEKGQPLAETPEVMLDKQGQPLKLSREQFIKEFGKDAARRLPRGMFGATKKAGVSVDELAPLLGFNSGRDMLESFSKAEPRDRAIERQTQERVTAEYGPALKAMQDAAMQAVHNDASARATLLELRAMAKEVDPSIRARVKSIDLSTLKATAERIVTEGKVGELDPARYARTERATALKAAELWGRGEKEAAIEQREARLLNQLLYRAARDAEERVEKVHDKLTSTSDNIRANLGKADPSYRDVHDALLAAVGIGEKAPQGHTLDEMLKKADEDAQEVAFDVDGVRQLIAQPTAWEELTVDQVRTVADAVTNIRHIARQTNELELAGRRQEKAAYLEELAQRMDKVRPPQPAEPYSRTAAGFKEKARRARRGASTLLQDVETWAEMMDGGTDGPAHRLLIDSRLEARNTEAKLQADVLKPIKKLWDSVPKDIQKLRADRVDVGDLLPVPEGGAGLLDPVFTRDQLWSLFLNWGNEGNRQRIRDGNGWTDDNVQKALSLLSKPELKFLQGVLDTIETLWPALSQNYEKRTGLQLDKVEATPLSINGEEFRGGYFPLKYDSRFSKPGEMQEGEGIKSLFAPNYVRPTVSASHTKERADRVAAPVDLTWGTVPAHLTQVVHDIAYGDWVRQTGGVLLDKGFKSSVTKFLGPERAKEFVPWLRDVANARVDSSAGHVSDFLKNAGAFGRSRIALAAIGLNIPALGRHLFDPWTTLADSEAVLPQHITGAYLKVMNPANWNSIPEFALSKELAYREAMHKENLRSELGRMAPRQGTVARVTTEVAFKANEWMDHFTSRVTFKAAFDQATADGMSPEDAAARADDVVRRALPSGDIAEKPPLLRTKNGLAAAVMFYGYASKMHNLRARSFDAAWRSWNSEEAQPKDKAAAIATVAAKWIALGAVSTVGAYFAGRAWKKNEDPVEWAGTEILLSPLDDVAIVGPAAKKAVTGHKVNIASAPGLALTEQTFQRLGDLIYKPSKAKGEEKVWNSVEALLSAFGPVGQVHRSVGYVRKVETGEVRPRGPADVAGGLIYGTSKNPSANPLTDLQTVVSGR
jgi:GGDEF domain-containing protein